jgi:hypothetical protein
MTRKAPPRTASRGQLASPSQFLTRVGRAATISLSLVGVTLAIGILGYHYIADLRWLEAFHQAALLLSGMGPVATNLRDSGRVFESVYALFCGVILLGATGILFTPVIHRLLHRFHIEDTGGDG